MLIIAACYGNARNHAGCGHSTIPAKFSKATQVIDVRRFWILAIVMLAACAAPSGDQQASDEDIIPPSWINRPNDRDLRVYFPLAAQHAGVGGRVQLDCIIQLDTRLDCAVASEEPAGYGFGEAALQMSRNWRVRPTTRGGVPLEGVRLRVPINFNRP